MAHLSDASQPISFPARRRHDPEPPRFWFGIIGGSIAVHLLLLLSTVPLIMRFSIASEGESNPTPVEVVDLPTDVLSTAVEPDTNTASPQLPSSATTQPDTSAPSSPSAQEEIGLTAQVSPDGRSTVTDRPTFTMRNPPVDRATPRPRSFNSQPDNRQVPSTPPESNSTPESPPTESPRESQPPQSPSTPEPPLDRSPQPDQPPPSQTESDQPPSDATSDSSPNSGSTSSDGESDSDSELDPTFSNEPAQPDLPSVNISELPPGTGTQLTDLSMSIAGYESVPTLVNGSPKDVPETSARPLQSSQELVSSLSYVEGTCQLNQIDTAMLEPLLEQSVPIRLVIDEQGTVAQTVPIDNSVNPVYLALADCVLRQWQFEPAKNGDSPVFSDDLVVDLVLSKN